MKLSTIIVTWNSEGHIQKCLSSLAKNGPKDNQIIVVDNASSDRTVAEVRTFPNVQLIVNEKNLGLGVATCQAYEQAIGELLLVINPDIYFTVESRKLLDHARNHPEDECMMPSLNPSKEGVYGTNPVHWHRFPFHLQYWTLTHLDKIFRGFLTTYCLRGEHSIKLIEDEHIYGVSCMLLRRQMIDRIGGIYKPEYFLYWADADLGMRLGKFKVKGCGVPEALTDHFGGHSSARMNPRWRDYLNGQGKSRFEKDWGHATRFFVCQFIDSIFLLLASKVHRRISMESRIVFLKGLAS